VMIIGIFMAVGKYSFFYKIMIEIFPMLGLSRFHTSDYAVFIVIPIFVFAIIGLKAILDRKFTLKSFVPRIAIIISWFSYGIYSLYSRLILEGGEGLHVDVLNRLTFASIIILAITLSVILIIFIKSKNYNLSSVKKPIGLSFVVLVFFGGLILVEGFIVISDNPRWKLYPLDEYYIINDYQIEKNGKLNAFEILENLPDQRPTRVFSTGKIPLAFKGYLDGSFYVRDSSRPNLLDSSAYAVTTNPYRPGAYPARKFSSTTY